MAKDKFDINQFQTNTVLNKLNVGVVVKDCKTGEFKYCNRFFCKLFGFKKSDVIGKDLLNNWGKDVKKIHKDNEKKLLKTKKTVIYNVKLKKSKDNEGRTFRITKSLINDTKSNRSEILGIIEDITEQELKNERLDLALNVSDLGWWDWNIQTNKVYYSPSWKSILGYKDDEIENSFDQWRKLLHPEDLKFAENYVSDYVDGKIKGNLDLSYRMRHKNGNYVDISSSALLVKNEKNKAIRIVGTNRDVTQAKKTEEYLSRYKRGFEKSSNSMVLSDYIKGEVKITQVNSSFTKIFGYTLEEVKGKDPKVLQSGFYDKEFYKSMWGDILNPKIGFWSGELQNKRKSGELVDIVLTINTFFDDESKPTGFVAHHTDISQINEAKESLKEKIEELEEFNSLIVDREIRMIELKEEIIALKEKVKGKKEKSK